ncbi:MAG: SDR family NAD(P)-dependent oxidoreductase [Erythrobacteraceae bacterium]|jgi:NAD(P)-dependent dehydrogenase (short-subunit alcohol dehydrogenase family)
MDPKGKLIAITGGGGGIGAALARRFALAGAAHIVIADRDIAAARSVADEIGGSAQMVDVADAGALLDLVDDCSRTYGPIDIFCSNAGFLPLDPDFDDPQQTTDVIWQHAWEINVMAHVRAARAVLPSMLARGQGHLLQTVSAAGLLTMIGSSVYASTKHAAIGFAESLAIAHRDRGIGVSVLAPQAVATAMTDGKVSFGAELNGVLTADAVANAAIEGVMANRFLILPHAEVRHYMCQKAEDPDRWIAAMAKLRRRYAPDSSTSVAR